MLKFSVVIFTLFLAACSGLPPVRQLPEQSETLRLFKVENATQVSLLSIQFEPQQWRWVQSDPLGAPIARALLSQYGWENDGFIMPNRNAKRLFTALAVALNPQNPPFILDSGWKISGKAPHFDIELPDGSIWSVDELK